MIDEIIKQSKIEGNILTLPPEQLDRKTYLEVAKKLEFIGGKWSRKFGGFIFKTNPKELLPEIFGVKNIKKELQFFETPESVADYLVMHAPKGPGDVHAVLEPSAGRGAIVRAINRAFPSAKVDYCEISPTNRKLFDGKAKLVAEDFLDYCPAKKYDAVIANPPFAKNQDIEHFYKMCEVCKSGGFVLSIMSNHWRFAEGRKEIWFREFLNKKDAEIIDLEAGVFKESGTNVPSCIVRLKK